MKNRLPVNHYLHLREQDVDHEKALSHTTQRYGVSRIELIEALEESRRHHEELAKLLSKTDPPRNALEAFLNRVLSGGR